MRRAKALARTQRQDRRQDSQGARDREEAMIVAMQEKATEEQIDAVIDAMVEAGVGVHRTTGATPDHSGRRGTDRQSGPEQI